MTHTRKPYSFERRITLSYRVIVFVLLTVSAFMYVPEELSSNSDDQMMLVLWAMIVWGVGRGTIYLNKGPKVSKDYPPNSDTLPQVSELLGGAASSPYHLKRIASLTGHPNINILSAEPTYHVFPTPVRFFTNLIGASRDSDAFSMSYLFCAIDLQKPVPHIFIDALAQNVFTTKSPNLWALSKLVSSRDRLPALEGNFPKYFSVYAADRNALDALSVLTPDVMVRLLDEGYHFDYELHGTHLYIIAEPRIRTEDFLSAAQKIMDELVPQIKKISFTKTEKELGIRPRALRLWALLYGIVILTRKIILIMLALAYSFILGALLTGDL